MTRPATPAGGERANGKGARSGGKRGRAEAKGAASPAVKGAKGATAGGKGDAKPAGNDPAATPAAGATAVPPPRRLALLGALLAVAAGGAYMTYGTTSDAAPESAPVPRPAAARAAAARPDSARRDSVPPDSAPQDSARQAAAPTGAAPTAAASSAADRPDSAASGDAAAPDVAEVAEAPRERGPAPDTVVLEREVFGYAGTGRRDPFRPLIATTVLRPFPSELRLAAVAWDPAGANSVAILRDLTTKTQHRVRVGQLVGRMRVVRIQPKAVVFAVEELGFSRTETLTLQDSSATRQP